MDCISTIGRAIDSRLTAVNLGSTVRSFSLLDLFTVQSVFDIDTCGHKQTVLERPHNSQNKERVGKGGREKGRGKKNNSLQCMLLLTILLAVELPVLDRRDHGRLGGK